MKFLLVLSAAVALSLAAPPRPSARLILLPRQSAPPPPQTPAKPEETPSARVLDSGEYYVLTPEGKLQMVKYTTAALQDNQEAAQPVQVPQPFAQFQLEYLQYPGKSQISAPAQPKADYKNKQEEAADFEAKLEYRDVKPIPAPIYAYNPEPLVRILKK